MAIHMTEAEASRDFAGVLAKVRAGEEVVIDDPMFPAVVLKSAIQRFRRLSEIIASMEERARLTGSEPVMDEDFAADMREIIRNRDKRPRRNVWE